MRAIRTKLALVICAMLVLSGCANRQARIAEADGPDEFAVLPGKPLQLPDNYTSLPDPTPGADNLTDPTPHTDAIAALGGRAAATPNSGIAQADSALINYTSRFGVESWARGDQNTTRRLFGFRGRSLDPYKELARLRAAGVMTPSAPARTDR